jgi:tRNA uridine 5-carboxymethylaminomethyl modification enzyme
MGLASQERMDSVLMKREQTEQIKKSLQEFSIEPAELNSYLESIESAPIQQKQKASQVLLRPNISLQELIAAVPRLEMAMNKFRTESLEQAEIQLKYDVYIEKEKELVGRMNQMENLEIPETFDYTKVAAISNEAREKLKRIRPRTLGQASRISGINPSDVQILMVYMGR